MAIKSLIINPGSTSTKIGVFEDETLLFEETLRHSTEEIAQYASIVDQKDFRKQIILDLLKSKDFDINSLQVVVGRGGMLKPIPGGTYAVSDDLLEDLKVGKQGQHASNLGGILPSTSVFHALNQKAVAKRFAKEQGRAYNTLNLVVVHMGGGVSVGAHEQGRVIDVFNALDGDGAFSPERAGAVPSGALIKMCFSGEYTEKEVYKKIVGNGGFNAYVGTNDMRDVEKMVNEGDKNAEEVREAFIMQVAKNIGSMSCVLKGKVDQIIITGGIAYDKVVVSGLKDRVGFIAPITVYPGEDELLALAQGALRVMNGEEEAMTY